MKRFNLLEASHLGIRFLMSEISNLTSKRVNLTPEYWFKLEERWNDLIELLANHLASEEQFILSKLSHSIIEKQHTDLTQLENQLTESAQALFATKSNLEDFHLLFTTFQANYLLHIFEEETSLLQALHQKFTDTELTAIHQQILANLAPEIAQKWNNYIDQALIFSNDDSF